MKEKNIQKSNTKFKAIVNHIKKRCNEENIKISNKITLVYNKNNTLVFFKLNKFIYNKNLDKKQLKQIKFPFFNQNNICEKCLNYNNKIITIIEQDSGQYFEHEYQDCDYCLSNLYTFLKSRGIKKYRIRNNEFKEKVWITTKDNFFPNTLFSKANEHYISASELSQNPITVEQSVINYSECLEKILKGIGLIHNVATPKTHNLEEIYKTIKIVNPNIFSFNLKLLKELSYAYQILRYKEQKVKKNDIIKINITNIKQEVDYIINNLEDYLKYQEQDKIDNIYKIRNPWFYSYKKYNEYNNINIFNTLNRKKEFYLCKESVFFKDKSLNRFFYIDKYYQSFFNDDYFFYKINKNSLSYESFLRQKNNIIIKVIVNGMEYIKKD